MPCTSEPIDTALSSFGLGSFSTTAGSDSISFGLKAERQPRTFKFIHASDPHIDSAHVARVRRFTTLADSIGPALTLVAGAGHWLLGAVDWHLMGVLLLGSLPGIIIGSYAAVRVPQTVLRVALASILIVVAGNIASKELNFSTSTVAAVVSSTGR